MYYIKVKLAGVDGQFYMGKTASFSELSPLFCGRDGYATKKYAQAAVRRLVKADEEIGIDNCTYSVVFQYEEGE